MASSNRDGSSTIDFDSSQAKGVITLTAGPLSPVTGVFPGQAAFHVAKNPLTLIGNGQTNRHGTAANFRL